MMSPKSKKLEPEDMPDRNELAGSWLATFVALTAVGIGTGRVQAPLPAAVTPTGSDLFKQQCATCHSLNAADPPRQGPVLAGIYGRKPGTLAGFHYSPGYAEVDFVWDEEHLDTYLTDPQALIPGAIMLYKQKNAAVRKAIISFLKELK
jgi:cytochrome c